MSFKPLDEVAGLDFPDADDEVEGAGGDEAAVGGDGDGGDACVDAVGLVDLEDLLHACVHVPDARRAVSGA